MMLRDGQTFTSLGIPAGAAYRFSAVAPLLAVITPWQRGAITYIALTPEQQIEMATQDCVIVPLLCWGPGGVHTHPVALLQE